MRLVSYVLSVSYLGVKGCKMLNGRFSSFRPNYRQRARFTIVAWLLIITATLVGTGVYVAVGGTKVNFALSDPFAAALVAIIIVRCGLKRIALRTGRLVTLALVLSYAWSTAIALSAIVPLVHGYADLSSLLLALLKAGVSAVYLLLVPLAASNSLVDRHGIRMAIRAWVVAAAAQVLLTWIPGVQSVVYFGGRFQGLFRDPNLYAVFASQSAVIALGMTLQDNWGDRAIGAVATALCTAGVVLSGSRTGAAAYVATLAIAVLSIPRLRRAIIPALVGLAFLLRRSVVRLSDEGTLLRIGRASFSAGLADRVTTWESAFAAIRRSPIWGVGRDHFVAWKQSVGISSNTIPHSTYLGMIAETGVLGAFVFTLLFVGVPVLVLCNARRQGRLRRDMWFSAVSLALPAFWAGGVGLNIENYRAGWMLVGVMMALADTEVVTESDSRERSMRRELAVHPTVVLP